MSPLTPETPAPPEVQALLDNLRPQARTQAELYLALQRLPERATRLLALWLETEDPWLMLRRLNRCFRRGARRRGQTAV